MSKNVVHKIPTLSQIDKSVVCTMYLFTNSKSSAVMFCCLMLSCCVGVLKDFIKYTLHIFVTLLMIVDTVLRAYELEIGYQACVWLWKWTVTGAISLKIEEPSRTKRGLSHKILKIELVSVPIQGSNFYRVCKFHSKWMFKACVRDTGRHSRRV